MRNVIFAAPILNANALATITAVSQVANIELTVISQEAESILPSPLRETLRGFFQVQDALDESQLYEAALKVKEYAGDIHRMFASNEQVQVPVAGVRERMGIKGMSQEVMRNFRDKSLMKSVLREHDIPCAQFMLANDNDQAWQFIQQAGYPVIVKPPEGAGAEFTYLADNDHVMREILERHPVSSAHPLLIEEFITGEEHSFDAFTIKGKTVWHSLTNYLPSPLEVKRNPWIQWRVVLPREVDDPRYDDIRKVGNDALVALGAKTGISHMEWFRRTDGSLAISEVGMRPPGAQFTTLMSRAFNFNCLEAWARAMITGRFSPPVQHSASGCAYLRGQGIGNVSEIHGFEQVRKDIGELITDYRLPDYGQVPTGSYEGEGFVIVTHPETSVVEDALLHIVSTVRIVLG